MALIDRGPVVLPFVRRLARDNGWSAAYAERVLREYKRFVYLAVRAGDRATALQILGQNRGGFGRSVTFTELGMQDSAFANLDHQVGKRNMGVILTLRADPVWDPLRDDPRFDELVVKAGLDDESR